jgi:hypothetical protein
MEESSMQYSGTFSAGAVADRPDPTAGDPIGEAREMLRKAARLPFAASHPLAWSSKFAQLVGGARGCVWQHITKAARPDSALARVERDEPRLHPAIERQREEHADLARQVDDLYSEVSVAGEVDIWRMIELGERAILLEMQLARHQNRLLQMMYESTHVDIGGEA